MRCRAAVVVVLAMVLVAAACSSSGTGAAPASVVPADEVRVVLVGGDEVIGSGRRRDLAESWPQLVLRDSLPLAAVYVNLGVSGFGVGDDAAPALAEATELQPALALVWAGPSAAVTGGDGGAGGGTAGFDRAAFAAALETLLAGLAPARVLVATLPPGSAVDSEVRDAANDVIRSVAARVGAGVVELAALPAPVAFEPDGELTEASNRAVAERFGAAIAALVPPLAPAAPPAG